MPVEELLKKLETQETTEGFLINLYSTVLAAGASACFPPEKEEIMMSKMKILADDSRRHRQIIQQIQNHIKFL